MLKNISINFLIVMSSILIAILILEILTRIFIPQKLIYYNNDLWKAHDGLGWNHYKNIDINLNPGGGGLVRFITDSHGYRIGINEKQNSEYKVVIIGDSFLEAFQVENDYIIPSLLKDRFYRDDNKDIKFYNTAVSGWNPNHYLIETKRFLNKLDADLAIIFLYAGNDLKDEKINYFEPKVESYPSKFKFPSNLTYEDIKYSFLLPINDFLETRFHLFILFKTSFETALSKVGLTHYMLEDIFIKNNSSVTKAEITAEICNNISYEFDRRGIKSLFVLLPASYQVDKELFNKYIEGFNINLEKIDLYNPNKLLKQKLLKYNIHLLDPINIFLKSARKGVSTHGKIDRHFNENGHAIVADFLYPIVKKNLF